LKIIKAKKKKKREKHENDNNAIKNTKIQKRKCLTSVIIRTNLKIYFKLQHHYKKIKAIFCGFGPNLGDTELITNGVILGTTSQLKSKVIL